MTEQLRLRGEERVLEVGTGSGYQAAVLAELAREVYTIEIVEELAERARQDLERLGYRNVHVRVGDGYRGWPEQAPFDAIIVTAAPDHVPQPLVEQLAVGGRLVLPVGSVDQELLRIERDATGIRTERLIDVRFVPMRGEAEQTE
jgi:protein-L-isoaspartate(D-aspartate) O-methyltransferase